MACKEGQPAHMANNSSPSISARMLVIETVDMEYDGDVTCDIVNMSVTDFLMPWLLLPA